MARPRRAAVAFAVLALLTGSPAGASHDMQFDVTQGSYVKSQHASVGLYAYLGAALAPVLEVDAPSGYAFAEEGGVDSPSDGEVVGSITVSATWAPLCSAANRSADLRWESTFPLGSPSGTSAVYTSDGGLGLVGATVYVVKEGTSDYRLVVDLPEETMCSSTTNGSVTLTVLGTTGDGSKVVRNPGTAGAYTWSASYTDTASPAGSHSDTDSVTITN